MALLRAWQGVQLMVTPAVKGWDVSGMQVAEELSAQASGRMCCFPVRLRGWQATLLRVELHKE